MHLHEKIRIVRKTKGLEQKYIAKSVGMSVSSYNMKENGKRPITTNELESIAKSLNEKVSIFFDEKFHVKWNSVERQVN